MFIFKRVKVLEDENYKRKCEKEKICEDMAELAYQLSETKKLLKEIQDKLPDYEEAIGKGVVEMWDRAVSSIVNYNPMNNDSNGGGC